MTEDLKVLLYDPISTYFLGWVPTEVSEVSGPSVTGRVVEVDERTIVTIRETRRPSGWS